ncbi:MAG: hypothetical protein QG608_1877 [Actinomycetota bacterium]|nr:hypothetical protein [Actinomycetota bacterium]
MVLTTVEIDTRSVIVALRRLCDSAMPDNEILDEDRGAFLTADPWPEVRVELEDQEGAPFMWHGMSTGGSTLSGVIHHVFLLGNRDRQSLREVTVNVVSGDEIPLNETVTVTH